MDICFLEGYFTPGHIYSKVAVNHLPFVIGRKLDAGLPIDADTISRHHAEIFSCNGQLCIRDLGSTNGTFLNDNKIIQSTPIEDGDILRLGDVELRIIIDHWNTTLLDKQEHTYLSTGNVLEKIVRGAKELKELIQLKQVKSLLQPIFDHQLAVVAYELLGRGNHPLLPESPGALFYIAEQRGAEIALSELFLEAGLLETSQYPQDYNYFFNIHPKEIEDKNILYQRLEKIREIYPHTKLVLEIPEKAVSDIEQMTDIKNHLHALKIGLAYDDFGAGQARLLELSEASPDVLKFDICLIHSIDTASHARQRMIEMLVNYSHDQGIRVLAEGIETANEDKVCRQIGIDLLQGFYYGKPGERVSC
ncbi:EAL domain-containing protein [Nitrosomonas communis]|uniref:EAL domain, c-di-GMP-specific phosphodiesterase class I (Or its enzymatically inactive variant) n=1 Tax=Nitrosomonas communis TaxID=44574 RepID=A0A1H2V4R8_9PROT|nr:EAL domain-containing protein [Nitrosomonas communis]SDW63303.1 EAL domain, c-di-GMP-specific phosphodiesterase class I (or its enzymatically inactive variant) [Nitrosomonas communis]